MQLILSKVLAPTGARTFDNFLRPAAAHDPATEVAGSHVCGPRGFFALYWLVRPSFWPIMAAIWANSSGGRTRAKRI